MSALLNTLCERRTATQNELEVILAAPEAEERDLNEVEAESFDDLRSRIVALDERIAELRDVEERNARAAAARNDLSVTVKVEPRTYQRGGPHSFLRDLVRAQKFGDAAASERLGRHQREIEVIARNEPNSREARAVDTTTGSGGAFIPPLYLEAEWIAFARAGRVFADQLSKETLPSGTNSINVPKVLTGTAVGVQGTQNTAVTETDITTGFVTSPVVTLAGQQTISLQALEQSPVAFDQIIFQDLQLALNQQVDNEAISGSGSGGHVTGVLNTSGITAISAATVTGGPTAANATVLYSKVSSAVASVNTQRFLPATHIFMNPIRWAWFVSAVDGNSRPLVVPNGGSFNTIATASEPAAQGFVGSMFGLPVYVDPNLPGDTSYATPTTDDIVVCRASDAVLFEGEAQARVLPQTYGNQLSVLLQVYEYAALGVRYGPSFAVVSGMSAPTL